MLKFKKIEAILLIIPILMILMLPIASAEVTADTYQLYTDYQRYYYMVDGSTSVIEDEYTNIVNNGDFIPITNNTISNNYQYPNAYGYEAIQLGFEFPSSEYVLGQSYQLRFNVSESQNYIYTYFLPYALPYFNNKYFEVGDTYYPYALNSAFLSTLSENQKKDMITKSFSGTNEVVMDITIPEDYLYNMNEKSDRSLVIYMYATYWANDNARITNTTYSNIRLIPTGSTQYLYSDKVYQENVENELSDINQGLEEQNSQLQDTNNKLDDILDQPEEERSEALQESNDAVNGIISGIDDKGPGFFNAIQGLVQALSYNGTEAKWNFPEVKLPKIEGAWEELVLIQSQEIDFNFWFDKIPVVVINLVRALSTILLVVFCFRELYSTIQYVMTLRGGG